MQNTFGICISDLSDVGEVASLQLVAQQKLHRSLASFSFRSQMARELQFFPYTLHEINFLKFC